MTTKSLAFPQEVDGKKRAGRPAADDSDRRAVLQPNATIGRRSAHAYRFQHAVVVIGADQNQVGTRQTTSAV